jgi:hypothetical protein
MQKPLFVLEAVQIGCSNVIPEQNYPITNYPITNLVLPVYLSQDNINAANGRHHVRDQASFAHLR